MPSTKVLLLKVTNTNLQTCHKASSGKILILLILPKKIERGEKARREEGKNEMRASSKRRGKIRETTMITTEEGFWNL
jgi:hypothetical protein